MSYAELVAVGVLHDYPYRPGRVVALEILALRRRAEAENGVLIIEAAPGELKREVESWGTTRGDFRLMSAIKHEFDPDGIFSPGRFVGGI